MPDPNTNAFLTAAMQGAKNTRFDFVTNPIVAQQQRSNQLADILKVENFGLQKQTEQRLMEAQILDNQRKQKALDDALKQDQLTKEYASRVSSVFNDANLTPEEKQDRIAQAKMDLSGMGMSPTSAAMIDESVKQSALGQDIALASEQKKTEELTTMKTGLEFGLNPNDFRTPNGRVDMGTFLQAAKDAKAVSEGYPGGEAERVKAMVAAHGTEAQKAQLGLQEQAAKIEETKARTRKVAAEGDKTQTAAILSNRLTEIQTEMTNETDPMKQDALQQEMEAVRSNLVSLGGKVQQTGSAAVTSQAMRTANKYRETASKVESSNPAGSLKFNTLADITEGQDPQVISDSMDATIETFKASIDDARAEEKANPSKIKRMERKLRDMDNVRQQMLRTLKAKQKFKPSAPVENATTPRTTTFPSLADAQKAIKAGLVKSETISIVDPTTGKRYENIPVKKIPVTQ